MRTYVCVQKLPKDVLDGGVVTRERLDITIRHHY
jgi:hypothetical protein